MPVQWTSALDTHPLGSHTIHFHLSSYRVLSKAIGKPTREVLASIDPSIALRSSVH